MLDAAKIICSKCGTEGIAGKKFCAECGSLLSARCSNCNSDNAPGAKFCADCGTPLSAPAGSPVSAPPPLQSRAPAAPIACANERLCTEERRSVFARLSRVAKSCCFIENHWRYLYAMPIGYARVSSNEQFSPGAGGRTESGEM